MKLKLIGWFSATMLAWAAAIAPASAAPITYNFFTMGGSPGSPGALLNGGVTTATFGQLTVTSESNTGATCTTGTCTGGTWGSGSGELYIKNGGTGSEQGLGLNNDAYPTGNNNGGFNEISYPNGIELSSQYFPFTGVSLGSLQNGEGWAVLGWDTTTNSWNTLGSGMGGQNGGTVENFSLMGMNYSTILVYDPGNMASNSSGSNDILLLSASTVPEPGTLALLALGLAGIAFTVSRRRKAGANA